MKFLQLHHKTMEDVLRAAVFAAEKHRHQKRKGDETPYIKHPLGVAYSIIHEGGIDDPIVLISALLHDTIEDTDTTLEEIEREFGAEVRSVVAEVTDDRSLSKVARKRAQIEHAKHISSRAKLVKLADKLYNLRDLAQCPIWSVERVNGYFAWSWLVIENLRGTNPGLEASLDKVFRESFSMNLFKHDVIVDICEKYFATLEEVSD